MRRSLLAVCAALAAAPLAYAQPSPEPGSLPAIGGEPATAGPVDDFPRFGWTGRLNPHPEGALSGASIFLSPGHGWWYNPTLERWTTQRFNSHGVVEDHSNAEMVIQYLVPYLENAGANVYLTRERDMNTNMHIVGPEQASSGPAWRAEENPDAFGGGQLVAEPDDSEDGNAAQFHPDIDESGYYAVYAWYAPPREGEANEAVTYTVRHSGGETDFVLNQNHDEKTWKYLGTFWFQQGAADQGVSVSNASDHDGIIAAGAVRFGGGMGDTVDGGTVSGKPRWEESGYYYTRFTGFDPAVTGENRRWNQVHAMPRWAEWEMEEHEAGKSIYLSRHTNASRDGEESGISTFIYSVWAWGPPDFFHGFPGSRELAEYVHNAVLEDMRAGWDPQWPDVGIIGRWLGETNPNSNNKMPAMLLENGFHDNPYDAGGILQPQYRAIEARAIYRGMVEYFANEVVGFDIATLAPETPTNVLATLDADGDVFVSWHGSDRISYRLYESPDGKGFDNGREVTGRFHEAGRLAPGETRFYRVTAVNEGGESMPSEAAAVRHADGPLVLLVNGFDRLDRGLNIVLEDGEERGIIARMNTRDYAIQFARALPASVRVATIADESAPLVDLAAFDGIVWMLGQEEETLTDQEIALLTEYVDGGGALMVTGTNWAEDLAARESGQAFLRDVLEVEFAGEDAGTTELALVQITGQIAGRAALGTNTAGAYPVRDADVLRPVGEAQRLIAWNTEELPAAGVAARRTISYAFPLEAVLSGDDRRLLMSPLVMLLRSGE